jgi:hypothetical protein
MADKPTIPLPPMPPTMGECVDKYVQLRDAIKAADDAHKERTATARAYLEALNGELLKQLNAVGGDSIKTDGGTAYRTTRRSATISDGDAFRQFVIDNGMFDIVDWKANAGAVDDFVKSKGSLPPGVNYTETFTVGVRRA